MAPSSHVAGFAVTLFSSIVFVFLNYVISKEVKQFNTLAAIINVVAVAGYLIMALGESQMTIQGALNSGVDDRDMLWLRYAIRAINWPLITYTLSKLANGDKSATYFNMVLALVFQGLLFAGAISNGVNASWPLLGLGLAFLLPVVFSLLGSFRSAAGAAGASNKALYTFLAVWTFALWLGDIIVWGTAEAGKVATPDQEVITYAALDVASYSVFGFVLVLAKRAIAKSGSIFGATQTLTIPAGAEGKPVTVSVVNGQLVVA
jgi:bacteriorhodopsin